MTFSNWLGLMVGISMIGYGFGVLIDPRWTAWALQPGSRWAAWRWLLGERGAVWFTRYVASLLCIAIGVLVCIGSWLPSTPS